MPKKTTTLRKTAKKPAPKGKRAAKKRRRSAGGTLPRRLTIVQSDTGRALDLRARLGMSRARFARLVPMSTRNLAYLESGKPPTANLRRQLQELRRVVDALWDVIQKETVGRWLQEPNRAFDGLKPVEVIERGEVDRIWQLIFRLRSGTRS